MIKLSQPYRRAIKHLLIDLKNQGGQCYQENVFWILEGIIRVHIAAYQPTKDFLILARLRNRLDLVRLSYET